MEKKAKKIIRKYQDIYNTFRLLINVASLTLMVLSIYGLYYYWRYETTKDILYFFGDCIIILPLVLGLEYIIADELKKAVYNHYNNIVIRKLKMIRKLSKR